MHVLDIIILILATFLVFTGLKRGLIGEIIRLAAMIGGFFIAFLYYQELAGKPPFTLFPPQTMLRTTAAFLVIYLLCAAAILALGWFIRKVVHLTPLGWVDRLVGGLIGAVKTLFIAWVICLSISSLPARRIRNDFNNSIVYRGFTALPKALSLKNILHNRARLRTIFDKRHPRNSERLHGPVQTFKAAVDSAGKALSSGRQEAP